MIDSGEGGAQLGHLLNDLQHTAGRWHCLCLWELGSERRGRGRGAGEQKTSAMFAEYWLGRVPGGAASLLLTQACGVYDFQRLLQVTQRAHILHHDRQAERLAQSSPWQQRYFSVVLCGGLDGGQSCLNLKDSRLEKRVKKTKPTKRSNMYLFCLKACRLFHGTAAMFQKKKNALRQLLIICRFYSTPLPLPEFFLIEPVYLLHNIHIRPWSNSKLKVLDFPAEPLLSSLNVWRLPVEH